MGSSGSILHNILQTNPQNKHRLNTTSSAEGVYHVAAARLDAKQSQLLKSGHENKAIV